MKGLTTLKEIMEVYDLYAKHANYILDIESTPPPIDYHISEGLICYIFKNAEYKEGKGDLLIYHMIVDVKSISTDTGAPTSFSPTNDKIDVFIFVKFIREHGRLPLDPTVKIYIVDKAYINAQKVNGCSTLYEKGVNTGQRPRINSQKLLHDLKPVMINKLSNFRPNTIDLREHLPIHGDKCLVSLF